MRQSKIFPKTRRESPKDAFSPGTKLLIRGGFIEQSSRGIWIMTTLGILARRLAETIIREEMEAAGAVELELPILHLKAFWDETCRWDKYMGANIAFHLKDRAGCDYMVAPTAEEIITSFARNNIKTYRDLPVNFWQMSPKFRDEIRPRQGLVRAREFLMKDGYSFDVDEKGMLVSYRVMDKAYQRIFARCGFNFIKVEADSGAIGGSGSAEFMALTEYGEDIILVCKECHYGGNQEKACAFFNYPEEEIGPLQKIETPDIKTVEQLEQFVHLPASKMVKTIVMSIDEKPIIVSMRGDLEISETKLGNLLHAGKVGTADAQTVEEVTGAPVGFAGPINLFGKTKVPYYFDNSVEGLRNFLCGANKADVHYINVNAGRDFPEIPRFYDLSIAVSGQRCSSCKEGVFEEKKGIELGHIFQLQQAYSAPMRATFTDADGKDIPFCMGTYGIGVSRIVQAIVEQNNDERGVIWPWSITPFQMVVIPVKTSDQLMDAEGVYEVLKSAGFRVLLDDREARIGEKLTDAELLGWPFQIIVGKAWKNERKLEVRARNPRSYDKIVFQPPQGNSLPTAFMETEKLISYLKTVGEK